MPAFPSALAFFCPFPLSGGFSWCYDLPSADPLVHDPPQGNMTDWIGHIQTPIDAGEKSLLKGPCTRTSFMASPILQLPSFFLYPAALLAFTLRLELLSTLKHSFFPLLK